MKPWASVAVDPRTNSLLLSGQADARLKYRALIARLDGAVERSATTRVRYLRFANAEDLAAKPMIVVASKIDAAQDPGRIEALETFCRERKLPFFKMSAVTGEGIDALRYELARWVKQARQAQAEARTEATVEP